MSSIPGKKVYRNCNFFIQAFRRGSSKDLECSRCTKQDTRTGGPLQDLEHQKSPENKGKTTGGRSGQELKRKHFQPVNIPHISKYTTDNNSQHARHQQHTRPASDPAQVTTERQQLYQSNAKQAPQQKK